VLTYVSIGMIMGDGLSAKSRDGIYDATGPGVIETTRTASGFSYSIARLKKSLYALVGLYIAPSCYMTLPAIELRLMTSVRFFSDSKREIKEGQSLWVRYTCG